MIGNPPLAPEYDSRWQRWDDMKRFGPMSLHTRRLIRSLVADLDFRSVLDVGCGQGSPLEEIAKTRPWVKLAGIDISAAAVQLARERLPQARFHVMDVAREHLHQRFDLVLCTDVLEHISDDRTALENIHKMAQRWCLATSLQGRMRGFERHVGHLRNYRKGEFRARIENAGFVVRRYLEWGFPLYSPIYRDLLQLFPQSATTGRYGIKRKLLSRFLYYLFFANYSRFGDYVLCLAETR